LLHFASAGRVDLPLACFVAAHVHNTGRRSTAIAPSGIVRDDGTGANYGTAANSYLINTITEA